MRFFVKYVILITKILRYNAEVLGLLILLLEVFHLYVLEKVTL
jgi:hypothetical protein